MNCALCNEPIDLYDIDVGAVHEIDGSYWHPECIEEYFEENMLEYALTD